MRLKNIAPHTPAAPGQFVGAFEKVRKATISFVMSVRPYGTTRLPLNGL